MVSKEKMKEKLLAAFKFTIELCEKHDLRYFTCGGTTLGAVRHHGLIPWDDDIDIYMPRRDYNKLLSLREELNGTNYRIFSVENPGYYLPYAKLCNTQTTIWENKYIPYIIGTFIDIFPLDYFDMSDKKLIDFQRSYFTRFVKYARGLQEYSRDEFFAMLRNCRLVFCFRKIICKYYYGPRRECYRKEFLKAQSLLEKDESGNKCVCLTQWIGKIFQRIWFEEYIEMPFADFKVRVPKGYHDYLTLLYGDYMQFPPLEDRVTGHSCYYINLNEGLTLEEVKERIRNGQG